MLEDNVDLEKEVIALGARLAQAKSKLALLDKENEVLQEVRKDLKAELMKVNAKINESELLNKFLLENQGSRNELFDKIEGQIKVLRDMRTANRAKAEDLNTQVVRYLTEDQKEKELFVEQSLEVKDFLEQVKRQIGKLQVPNFENLVKKNIDLEKVTQHNKDLEKLKELEQHEASPQINFMRRSSNYSSTGKLLYYH